MWFAVVLVILVAGTVFLCLWASLSTRVDELLRLNRAQDALLWVLQQKLNKLEAPPSEEKKAPVPVVTDDEIVPLVIPKKPEPELVVPPPPPPPPPPEPVVVLTPEVVPEKKPQLSPWSEPLRAPGPPEKPLRAPAALEKVPVVREEKPKKPAKEEAPNTILSRIWSWIVVGEEFRPKNVSLEYAVATTWLVRGAVLMLLGATAFFLHWAYERNLIRPEFRVGLTVLLGIGLAVFGLWLFRGKYRTIGLGLVGAGVGSLYFSVFSAHSLYHLCGAGSAILFTFLVTAAAVGIAVWKNMLPVAIIGTLAGYAAPILFSTGEKNYFGLFGYMLLLALGVGAANFKRNWKLLNLVAFLATWGIYALSLLKYSTSDFPVVITYLGVYSFFFALLPLIYAAGHKRNITVFGVLGIAANSLFTLSLGISLVYDAFGWKASAIVPFALGGLLSLLFGAGRALDREDHGAEAVYTVIAVGSFALGVGLCFGHAYITFTWGLMALALFAAASRMHYPKILNGCGAGLFAIAVFRLMIVDFPRYFHWNGPFSEFAFERLMTLGALILIAGATSRLLLRREKVEASQAFAVIALLGVWFYGFFEIRLLLGQAYVTLYWLTMAIVLFSCRKFRFGLLFRHCGFFVFAGALFHFLIRDLYPYFLRQTNFADHAWERLITLGALTAAAGIACLLFRELQKEKEDSAIDLLQVFALLCIVGGACYGSSEIKLLLGMSYLVPFWVVMATALLAAMTNPRLKTLFVTCGAILFTLAGVRFFFFLFNPHSYLWKDTVYSASFLERFLTMGAITLGAAVAWLIFHRRKEEDAARTFGSIALGFLWFYGTYEIGFFLKQWNGQDAGISIWWGLFAFCLLLGGILKRKRVLRRIALALFAVTVGKIFFFDLAHLEQIYRIAASAALALALLAAAFTYIRFRDKFEI